MAEQSQRTITIWILDRAYQVPGEGTLLHAFQYLRMRPVMSAGFCWNGECVTCEVEVDRGNGAEPVLACQTPVRDGLRVLDLSITLQYCLRDLPGVSVRRAEE